MKIIFDLIDRLCYIYKRAFYLYYNLITRWRLLFNRVEYGKGLRAINSAPNINVSRKGASMILGNGVMLNSYCNTSWYTKTEITVNDNAQLIIGDHTGLNGVLLYCREKISIGSYVNIGGGTRIYDTNFHPISWQKRRQKETHSQGSTAPVVIGDDVFIGTNCIIGKGVSIGARSVIAAGSVVVKDIPEDSVAGGNPCKVIKQLSNN